MTPIVLVLSLVVGQSWKASTAPGPPSKGHQGMADNCDACHMPFKGLPNEKCLTCHTGLKKFHASVAAQKCNACHGEHKGPTGETTKAAARAAFDHALTGVPLTGAHSKVACAKCHTKPIQQMTPSCGSCHADPHKGSLGATCQACHGASVWKPAARTKDQHTTSMKDGHAKATCVDCHREGKNLAAKVECAACHERAHGGTTAPCDGCHKVAGWKPAEFDHSFCTCSLPQLHQTVGCLGCHQNWDFTKTPTLCSGCHEKDRRHEQLGECSLCHSAVSWKKNRFEHNKRSKFKLTGQHLAAACEGCHPAQGKAGNMKFRGVPLSCEGCHQKQGDAAHGNFGACAKCHVTEGFDKPTFDHASTGFPLVGRHTKLKCQDCHSEKTKGYPKPVRKAELGRVNGFSIEDIPRLVAQLTLRATAPHGTTPGACSHCHADPHQGSVKEFGECSSCHSPEQWKPTSFDLQRHAATAFPLTGKHAAARCNLCHTEAKLDDVPQQCAKCHVDRHGGKLGDQCQTCHNTNAFKPATGFDHAKTGFTLTGLHAKVSCDSCHAGARGKALAAAAKPSECTTCHQPQHGRLGDDCASCHDPAAGPFAKARGMKFAHHETAFPLDRRHSGVRCGACHLPGGAPPPSARCGSCHPDPHRGQLGQGCEDCHAPDRWRVTRFDHDRTGWPLRGKHFVTPCVNCHTAQRWVGLTTECFDCHLRDADRGRAVRPDKHPFGPPEDCAICHASQWKW